jgi:hypothetical protein
MGTSGGANSANLDSGYWYKIKYDMFNIVKENMLLPKIVINVHNYK